MKENKNMMNIFLKKNNQTQINRIKKVIPGSWVDIDYATKEELQLVADLVDIELKDLTDVLDEYEVPRLERHDKTTILFLRTPEEEDDGVYTEILTIIISPKYFITISSKKNDLIKNLKLEKFKISTTKRGKMLVFFLTKIANLYTKNINDIATKVRKLKLTRSKISERNIVKLIEYEDILNQYQATLIPMKNVFESIVSGEYFTLYEDDNELLNDMIISIRQSVDVCDVNLKGIIGLRDSYQLIFTNNLNNTIKLLTVITIILTIPTMIAGIYGMNIPLPYADSGLTFWIIASVSIVISAILFVVFIIKKWL